MRDDEHWVRAVLSEGDAWARLRRPVWRRWSGTLMRRLQGLWHANRASGRRSVLRLATLPGVVIEVSSNLGGSNSKPIHLWVHGFSDQVEIWQSLTSGTEVVPEGIRRFPYPLTEGESLDLARQRLSRLRLGRLFTVRAGVEPELKVLRVVHYPYWVLYEGGYGRRVRFRMVDAVTGRRAGVLLRKAWVSALAQDQRPAASGMTVGAG